MIIGGIILLMLMVFNGNVIESAGLQTLTTTVQGNITTIADVVECDFRKMGYRVAYPQDSAITYAETTKIVFRGDFDDNSTIDKITYWLDTAVTSGVTNPRTRILYRKLNNQPAQAIYMGITRFSMQYYDERDTLLTSNPVAGPSKIQSIKLSVTVESSEPYDSTFVGAYWERKIRPRNIMNIK